MKKGPKKVRIPNPHRSGDIHISLVKEILRQAGIENNDGIKPDYIGFVITQNKNIFKIFIVCIFCLAILICTEGKTVGSHLDL